MEYELTDRDAEMVGKNLALIVDSEAERREVFNPEDTIEPRVYRYNPESGELVYDFDRKFVRFPACAFNFEVSREGRKGIARVQFENGASERVKGIVLLAAELYNMKDYLVKKGAVRVGKLKYNHADAVRAARDAVGVA